MLRGARPSAARAGRCPIRTSTGRSCRARPSDCTSATGASGCPTRSNLRTAPSLAPPRTRRDRPAPLPLARAGQRASSGPSTPGTKLRAELRGPGHEFPKRPLRRFLHWSEHFEVDLDEFDAGLKEQLLDVGPGPRGRLRRPGRHVHAAEADGPRLQGADRAAAGRSSSTSCGSTWSKDRRRPRRPAAVLHHVRHVRHRRGRHPRRRRAHQRVHCPSTATSSPTFLKAHGAEDFTLELAALALPARLVRRGVRLPVRERRTRCPTWPPGTGIHGILRLIGGYREHVAYKMQAGMGDTVFGPFYEVLRDRGVRFEFFREVTGLELSTDRTAGRRDPRSSARPSCSSGTDYDPLVDVAGLPCWPNEPRWDQLVDGPALRAAGVAFEHGGRAPGAVEQVLAHGTDFDLVVLAIPAPALGGICAEVADQVPALRHDAGQLPQRHDPGRPGVDDHPARPARRPVLREGHRHELRGARSTPTATCPTSWPGRHGATDPPLGVAYFCGVMADQPSQAAADAEVARAVHDLLDRATPSNCGRRRPGRTAAFDWTVLFDPGGGDDRSAVRRAVPAGQLRARPSGTCCRPPDRRSTACARTPWSWRPGRAPRTGDRQPLPGRRLDPQRHQRRLRRGGHHVRHAGVPVHLRDTGRHRRAENVDWLTRVEQ